MVCLFVYLSVCLSGLFVCFVLFCFVLFCFVLLCFALFCFFSAYGNKFGKKIDAVTPVLESKHEQKRVIRFENI